MMTNRYGLPTADRFGREMNNLLQSLFDGVSMATPRTRPFPAVNVWEDDENLYAEAEVPGLSMNDLEILVVGNEVTIKGRRNTPADENVAYHRQERGAGEFARVLTLPVNVNADRVEAVLKDGILMLTLPKAEEAKPRKINIRNT